MNTIKRKIIDNILRAEGGFINDPNDSGGPTNFGITRAVAREYGFKGPIKDLTRSLAFEIYAGTYWNTVRADDLMLISAQIAEEVVDTGVNMGPGRSAKFLQRVINVLNNEGKLYSDIKVDGRIGPKTISALEVCFRAKGERVILLALNCLQGSFYIALAESHPKNERFVYGWLSRRVVI